LNGSRGCGFLGVQDCYPCLRSGSELKDAIEAASKHEAPEIPGIRSKSRSSDSE
jgi:hypothetical protein